MALQQSIFYNIVRVRWPPKNLIFAGFVFPTVDTQDEVFADYTFTPPAAFNTTIGEEVRHHVDGTPVFEFPAPGSPESRSTVVFVRGFSMTPFVFDGLGFALTVDKPRQDFSFSDWQWDGYPFEKASPHGVVADPASFSKLTGGSVSGDVILDNGLPVLDDANKPFFACSAIEFSTKAYALTGEWGWFDIGDNQNDLRHFYSTAPSPHNETADIIDLWAHGSTMQTFSFDFTGAYTIKDGVRYNAVGANIVGDDPSVSFQILCRPE